MEPEENIAECMRQLQKNLASTVEALQKRLSKLRTGRASVGLLEDVKVPCYGSVMPLNQCASLQVVDARLVVVKPYDSSLIAAIDKAILSADLGIMTQKDATGIMCPFPPPTEERRLALAKVAQNEGEESKVGIRNHRRDANDQLKEWEKQKLITQDGLKKALKTAQDFVNQAIAKVENLVSDKKKEIMEI